MTAQACQLCGLPCGNHPYSTQVEGVERFFCCLGCMNVYIILDESGVFASGQDFRETEVYKRGLQLGLIAQAARDSTVSGQSADIPEDGSCLELVFNVSGMWCNSCAWLIEHAVKTLPGVVAAEASFATDLLRVRFQPQRIPPSHITDRVSKFGYRLSEFNPAAAADAGENRDLVLRFGLAAFFWLNIMTFSLALYVGYFERISGSVRLYMPFVLMVLATPVVFYCGFPLLRVAWLALRNFTVRMESLVSLGVLAAYLFSVIQTFRGTGHIYFDTASVIVTFVLAGKLIERNAKQKTSRWVSLLHQMAPNKVRILSGGRECFVSAEALQPDQLFLVKAGERFPADGMVEIGNSHADESLLTGEASPVAKRLGDPVVAGSVNLDGILQVRATRTGTNSTLSQIIALVEHSLSNRSPLEHAVDRASRMFVPSVIVLALATFTVSYFAGFVTFPDALMRSISILVIACPCALGLATPLAITAALGVASRQGILISDSRILETLSRVNHMLFDKTGTVTEGKFELVGFEFAACPSLVTTDAGGHCDSRATECPAGQSTLEAIDDKAGAFSLLASIEQYSEHPLGRAVVAFARDQNIVFHQAESIEIHKGLGISGVTDNHHIFIGDRRLSQQSGIAIPAKYEDMAHSWASQGNTVVFFGWDGELRGCLAFGDRPRTHARELLVALRRRGIQTHLLSGDSVATTKVIAQQLGTDDFRAQVLPSEKANVLRDYKSDRAVVAMVGDGINDAPALAEADLGIAMASGTDIAMRAASVVLTDNDLQKIPQVLDLAKKTLSVIRQNLFWAFIYNVLGITLAIAGILTPIFAATAMLLSSLAVVVNSLRLTRGSSSRRAATEAVPMA